jgi:chromosomal replication initiator protein
MPQGAKQSFPNWVALPENSAAAAAAERVAQGVCRKRAQANVNPLFLHGPSGAGKSHLVSALIARLVARSPDLVITQLPVDRLGAGGEETAVEDLAAARQADLVVVEDVQHLLPRGVESLVGLIDRCQSRRRQLVVTATVGPAELTHLPGRLTSRLASGLVVGLASMSPASRLAFLEDRTRRHGLDIPAEVLAWLAQRLPGSGRALEGAIYRLEALRRLYPRLDEELLADHFGPETDARRLTVERIAQQVGAYFQVAPRQLQSRGRSSDALLPRQIGMYLARRLTGLSLQQIGAYFGGRDHSTVLHACRKVEQALAQDVSLSGAVRQLHADLA